MKQKSFIYLVLLFIASILVVWVSLPPPVADGPGESKTALPQESMPDPEPIHSAAIAPANSASPSVPARESDVNAGGVGAVSILDRQTLSDVPEGEFRSQLLALDSPALSRALAKLRIVQVPTEDYASLRVAPNGALFYVDTFEAPESQPEVSGALRPMGATSGAASALIESVVASVPISSPPALSSLPGSKNVIYLDFNGHTITGTNWNTRYANDIYVALPYDRDGDPLTFSIMEQSDIILAWEQVAEDFAPFDVNVTTVEPAVFTSTTARALITQPTDANGVTMPVASLGGAAYLDVFGEADFVSKSSPALVYASGEDLPFIISHEIGHNLGLSHDGQKHRHEQLPTQEYYSGHGSGDMRWSPIMGLGTTASVSQWSKGEYLRSTNPQDDLAILRSKLGYRPDDAGATLDTAAALIVTADTIDTSGVTGRREDGSADIDLYAFSTGSGTITISANSYRAALPPNGGNTDIALDLLDADGGVVASSAPAGDTNASLSYAATAGTYYVRISPSGEGDPFADPPSGYTSYGSLGQYTISGTIIPTSPTITSGTTASTDAGAPFSYAIIGTNESTSYTATGLPSGLSIDTGTGIISGRATETGSFIIPLSASNESGEGVSSLTLTVYDAAPAITSLSPSLTTVTPGESPTLSVTALSANGPATYQWQHNGRDIPEATGTSLNLPEVRPQASGYYRVHVTNSMGRTRSDAVFVTVAPTATHLVFWGDNSEGRADAPSNLGATVQLVLGLDFGMSLQRDGTVIEWGPGSTSDLAVPEGLANVVKIAGGRSGSRVMALKSDGTVACWGISYYGEIKPPADLHGVVDIATCENTSFALKNDGTVVAWGQDDMGQASVPAGLSDVIAIAASGKHALAVKSDGSVVAWGDNRKGQGTVDTRAVDTFAITAGYAHSMAHQGNSEIVSWGSNTNGQLSAPTSATNLTAVVAGSDHNVGLKSDGTVVAWGSLGYGATNVPSGLSQVVSIAAGFYNSAAIRDSTLDLPLSFQSPLVDQSVALGDTVTFSTTVEGLPRPVLQWRRNGVAIPGATEATYSIESTTLADAGSYDVIASNIKGSVTSESAELTVMTEPVILTQPQALTTTSGSSATLSVIATGSPSPSYQWRKGGVPIPNATSNTLAFPAITLSDEGSYTVSVTNPVKSVTSTSATVMVQILPTIDTHPINQTALVGETITFSVSASGKPTPTFQWLKDGVPIDGATSSSLALADVGVSLSGSYSVVISNGAGSTTSDIASLTVIEISGVHSSRGYREDGTILIDNTITYSGPLTKLVWSAMPPDVSGGPAWAFVGTTGTLADDAPTSGESGLLDWAWNQVPASPFSFTYTLSIPPGTEGSHQLTAMIEATSAAGISQHVVRHDPLILYPEMSFHSADTDKDHRINLSELLRVIELYNSRSGTARTGRYKIDIDAPDGFTPDPSDGGALPTFHAADTDQNGQLSLSELLRVIEIYNTRSGSTRTGEYHIDMSTVDRFGLGPAD